MKVRAADLLKDVITLIEKHELLNQGDRIIVGVSGGADSVSLLHFLWSLREEYSLQISVAHLNHCFRGQEADQDALFVEQLASRLGLDCYSQKIDVPAYQRDHKLSAQLAARKVRYRFFEQCAEQWGADKIALAHNRDDQAETVLLRLIRGTGLDGLSGIPPLRLSGKFTIIRPFLALSRRDIEEYCLKNKLEFRTDRSNFKTLYLRNKIRLELLPHLKQEYNSRIDILLAQTAAILQEERKYLEQQTENIFAQLVEEVGSDRIKINLAGFQQQPVAIQRRLLRKSVVFLGGNSQELGFSHLNDLLNLINQSEVGAVGDLKQGLQLRKGYTDFFLERKSQVSSFSPEFTYRLILPGITIVPELSLIVEGELISKAEYMLRKKDASAQDQAFFSWEKLKLPLIIRTRRPGDRFRPLGMMGSKKIKKLFIDEKIPVEERDTIPLIISPEGIIWVVGCRQSQLGGINEDTDKILNLRIKPL